MTPEDRIRQHYAAHGFVATTRFDRDLMLSVIREQRRRYAHERPYAAMSKAAESLHRLIRDDDHLLQVDPGTASDILLAISSLLGTYAVGGMHPTALVNVIAYLADDLAKEAADRQRSAGGEDR
ncbi:hypothetical protein [Actinoallomurus sp. CA-142502]|uniref:hypothetical protein n=1 Tax=Actinoallomurus sp. CA-142502 TaxID=3239885 RepID=UPI003D8A20EC